MTRSRGSARLAILAPKGWPNFFLQAALLGSFTFIYALSGIYGRHEAATALTNARDVAQLERTLGLYWEHGVQNWVLRGPHFLLDIANRTYFICQFTVSTILLLWIYARRNRRFARVRNALLAANYVTLIVLFLYPMAPPRLVPGSGFVDTLNENAVNLQSSLIDALNNPYSAMPSLHASYAIVLGVAGFALVRRRWAKLLWALYPGLVAYSVIASGNHFVLDVVAGGAVLLATPLVDWAARQIARRTGGRSTAREWSNAERRAA